MFSVNVLDEVYLNGASGGTISAAHVTRTWNIGKVNANSGSGIDITFNWNNGETTGTIITATMYHFEGTWKRQTGTTSNSSTSFTFSGYTGSFSPFAIADGAFTLSVTWLEFNGRKESRKVDLSWSTAAEFNSSLYSIQHSTDRLNWNTIGTTAAAGNTDQISR